jgi:hypothetical protein
MNIQIPIERSFECPEGTFGGTFFQHCEFYKPTDKGPTKMLRLFFQPDHMSTDTKVVLVARNFIPALETGSDLYIFLRTWHGNDFLQTYNQNGSLNLDAMIGKRGLLVVSHYNDGRHEKPFANLDEVRPEKTYPKVKTMAPGISIPKTSTTNSTTNISNN